MLCAKRIGEKVSFFLLLVGGLAGWWVGGLPVFVWKQSEKLSTAIIRTFDCYH